jgi:hypothetical protein
LEEKYDEGGKYRIAYMAEKESGNHDHDESSNNN